MPTQPTPLLDDAFARLQGAEREAATSQHNDRPYPTEAQAIAGNYRHGWLTLHGLTIKIENVRNSIRSGTSAGGKRWANRMAASYGEIVGTRGADGDPIDVFIGAFPESTQVWVINQGWGDGAFDEHKVVIGAGSERAARDLYLASYDLGWTGLQSMHAATIAQLKHWLRNGDLTKPFTPQQLPLLDAAQSTMDKTLWNDQAEPVGKTLPAVLYGLRADDRDGLLLDSATLAEFIADALTEVGATVAPAPLLDALVIPVSRMTLRMEQLQRVMNAANTGLQVAEYTIADPIKARGVLQVAVQFALSDGQAITVWFHNPDSTPAKLSPLDELVSWKWMLNKKDITVVVAPERGRELNPREVGRRVMRLAEKNSTKFAEANQALAEKTAAIAALTAEIPALESRLAEVTGQVEAARTAKETAAAAAEAAANDPQVQRDYVLTAAGYASIRGDEAELLKWQDVLDAHFQGRIIEVRNGLRDRGWDGEPYKALTKAGFTLDMDLVQVGGGRNVVGAAYRVMDGANEIGSVIDTLAGPADDVALYVDMHVTSAMEARAIEAARAEKAQADAELAAAEAAAAAAAQAEADAAAAAEAQAAADAAAAAQELADAEAAAAAAAVQAAADAEAAAALAAAVADGEGDEDTLVADIVAGLRDGQRPITRLGGGIEQFLVDYMGDEVVLSDELRAEIEGALGEPLVEVEDAGRGISVFALIPKSMAPAPATEFPKVLRVIKQPASRAPDAQRWKATVALAPGKKVEGYGPTEVDAIAIAKAGGGVAQVAAEVVADPEPVVAEPVAPARSGTADEQAAADAALAMAAGVVTELGGTFTADGFSGDGTAGAWSYGNAEVNGTALRLAASGGGVVQVNGHPFDPAGVVMTAADQVRAAILAAAPVREPVTINEDLPTITKEADPVPNEDQTPAIIEPEPQPEVIEPVADVAAAEEVVDPQRAADAAYLNSLIDGTGDLLAADTFERLEPLLAKYEMDADMMALLEAAATKYGDAAQDAARAALQPA